MFISARKTMPALDYVSTIRSVYSDRRALLAGAFTSAGAAAVSAIAADAPILFGVAGLLILVGLIRYAMMRAFWKADIGPEDADTAEKWENWVLLGGILAPVSHGLWCMVSLLVVQHPYAELASCTLATASAVGMVARNFGLDRLVTIQIVIVSLMLGLAMVLRGDIYHIFLAAALLVMLISFRKLAKDIRNILLSAVHGRVHVSRLAAELDIAITTLEHGLCLLDETGVVTIANKRAMQAFALLDNPNIVGQPLSALLGTLAATGQIPSTTIDRLKDLIDRRASGKVLLTPAAGFYFEVTVSSREANCVLLFEDISERVAAEERIGFMAHHDVLTGLPNRRHFRDIAADELEVRRAAGQPTALIILDVDEFKHVNDSFGHVVGDTLLRQIAERLRQTIPAGAILARHGSDEFVVLAGYDGGDEAALAVAGTIQRAFETPFALDQLTLTVAASLGLVTSGKSHSSLDELLTKANLALGTARTEGRARTQIFHAQMDIDYHYRQRLKSDLRGAIDRGEFSLVFQPLFDIETRRVVSCEALARWTHPELGSISPALFIPPAADTGHISNITTWVIDNAVREAALWRGDVGVAVNISARDFRFLDLPQLVDTALARSKLPPYRLELEVTETAVIEEHELAHGVLTSLARRGIAIALDDFGTGYSSLSYLNALPFTKLKIDRSFLSDIDADAKALRLLTGVARIGRDLELIVVAEGVETESQLDTMLAHTDIQRVQGYLFSRPLPAADVAELIGRFNGRPAPAQRKIG